MSGLPGMLLAALILVARLIAPAMAMPSAADGPLPQVVICHAGGSGETPASTDHPSEHACLLCPACHLAAHAVVPMPASPGIPLPAVWVTGVAAALPPATGPPSLIQTAAQPTGPPRRIA